MPHSADTCRLLIHDAGDIDLMVGGWNMAVDEVLLEQASATGCASLRIYHWSQPTLSLGYFQSHADRQTHLPSRECRLIRRRSGGGAILHEHELTYALAIPIRGTWGTDPETLYESVHGAVIGMLNRYGCRARLYDGARLGEAFLCFERRERGDVICGEHKIMGSAQRRSKAALLQHGSLLLQRSEYAPSIPGVFDLRQHAADITELESATANAILAALSLRPVQSELSPVERQRAETIDRKRFSAEHWTLRR